MAPRGSRCPRPVAATLSAMDITPYLAYLPGLGAVLGSLGQIISRPLERRAKGHAELLQLLPSDSKAHAELAGLLESEVKAIALRERDRIGRKVNGTTVATIIVVSVVAGSAAYGLWLLGGTSEWWGVPLRIVAGAIAVFGGLLVGIGGVSTFWEHPSDTAPTSRSDA
jgi:hypothetical protein